MKSYTPYLNLIPITYCFFDHSFIVFNPHTTLFLNLIAKYILLLSSVSCIKSPTILSFDLIAEKKESIGVNPMKELPTLFEKLRDYEQTSKFLKVLKYDLTMIKNIFPL